MHLLNVIPKELQKRRQWVLYNGLDKVPQNLQGEARVNDSSTWLHFREGLSAVERDTFQGLGFVFTKKDTYCGIDLDDCLIHEQLSETAKEILAMFPGAYVERSMSKTGLHIIVGGSKIPGMGCKMYPKEEGFPNQVVEVYDQGRYFALTGDLYGNSFNGRIPLRQNALEEFCRKYFPISKPIHEALLPFGVPVLTDEEILSIASKAKNKERFNRLWQGNTQGYPSSSEAELALCGILAFYTQEPHQLKRLLRSSGMGREEFQREDYLDRTVDKALTSLQAAYTPHEKNQVPALDRVREFLETAEKGQATVDLVYTPVMVEALAGLSDVELAQTKVQLKRAFGREFLSTDFNKVVKAERKKNVRMGLKGELPETRLEFKGLQHLKQPPGFLVDSKGVQEYVEGSEATSLLQVAPAPIVIRSLLEDVSTQNTFFELAWWRKDEWITEILARQDALNNKNLVAIAKRGAPIDCTSSLSLVRYLHAFEVANMENLPVKKLVSGFGWQKNFFQLGDRAVGTEDEIILKVQGEGNKARAYAPNGSFEEWRALVERAYDFPLVMALLSASIAAPLLQMVDCPNFFLDVAYATSTGKSTAQRLAASVWGNPDERSANSLLHSWNATRVGIESLAGSLNSLPLLLDDTATVNHPNDIESIVYMVQQGLGKTRGAKEGGLQETKHFRTIVISTGEVRLPQLTQQGGATARILSLWGAPFRGTQSELVHDINHGVILHHGTAGERVINHLLRQDKEALKETWKSISETLQELVPKGGVTVRQADFFAVIMLGRLVANEALGLSIPDLLPLWKDLAQECQSADKAKEALEKVYCWSVANQSQFYGKITHSVRPSGHEGWAGRWMDGTQEISFITERLRDLLTRMSYSPKAILDQWKERGWLRATTGRLHTTARIDKQPVSVIALSQKAMELVAEDCLD